MEQTNFTQFAMNYAEISNKQKNLTQNKIKLSLLVELCFLILKIHGSKDTKSHNKGDI